MNGSEKEPLHSAVVSNSGPLIALATIGRLDLLKDLFGQVCIPQAVYDEVVVYGEGEPGTKETDEAEWIKTFKVEDRLAVSLLREEMAAGESEMSPSCANWGQAILWPGTMQGSSRARSLHRLIHAQLFGSH